MADEKAAAGGRVSGQCGRGGRQGGLQNDIQYGLHEGLLYGHLPLLMKNTHDSRRFVCTSGK